jgi:hypothetical protein
VLPSPFDQFFPYTFATNDMAMTKKDQAAMQAAIDRADTLAALRWTAPVRRDVDVPKDGYSEGWDYNTYKQEIFMGWSGPVYHGSGPAPGKDGQRRVSGSHGSRRLYSTQALALAAMRHEIEQKAAADLLKIDRQIAALQESVTEPA